jgi:hypothetical protein
MSKPLFKYQLIKLIFRFGPPLIHFSEQVTKLFSKNKSQYTSQRITSYCNIFFRLEIVLVDFLFFIFLKGRDG